MLVLGAALVIFRSVYLNSVPNSVLPSDAAAALFDTFVRFIKDALRTLLVLVVILIAVLLLAVLGLIELIGRPPARPEMTAHP